MKDRIFYEIRLYPFQNTTYFRDTFVAEMNKAYVFAFQI